MRVVLSVGVRASRVVGGRAVVDSDSQDDDRMMMCQSKSQDDSNDHVSVELTR